MEVATGLTIVAGIAILAERMNARYRKLLRQAETIATSNGALISFLEQLNSQGSRKVLLALFRRHGLRKRSRKSDWPLPVQVKLLAILWPQYYLDPPLPPEPSIVVSKDRYAEVMELRRPFDERGAKDTRQGFALRHPKDLVLKLDELCEQADISTRSQKKGNGERQFLSLSYE